MLTRQGRQLSLDLIDRRQTATQFLWETLNELSLPFGDAHRLGDTAQRVLGYRAILIAAEDETDRGVVRRMFQLVIDGVQVEVKLSDMLWLEAAALELDDDKAAQLEMIEEQVNVKVTLTDLKMHLTTDERETGTELDQKPGDVLDKGALDLALMCLGADREKVEEIGVLERLRQDQIEAWAAARESW